MGIPRKYIAGLVAVVVLALAVWLVPMALAQGSSQTTPSAASSPAPSATSGTTHHCP